MKTDILQKFLNENEIPKIEKKPKTFLEIAKQPHYENVLSNIYAFYFNVNEEHNLQDLFITSFLELIRKQIIEKEIPNKELENFNDFEVFTEYYTKKKGRIDILLTNSNQNIIIENKVNHHIKDNDFVDYWNTAVKKGKENESIGVVLSVKPINYSYKKGSENFINITHLDFLKNVLQNLGNYLLDANETYVTFLKDFIQNIINLSTKTMKIEDVEFYFKNQTKINQIAAFKNNVKNFISKQIEEACNEIDESLVLSTPREGIQKKRLRMYTSSTNKNLMFTIVFEDLLASSKRLHIIVELKYEELKNKERFKSIEFTEEEKKVLVNNFYTNPNKTFCHFAITQHILSDDDILNLKDFILKTVEEKKLLLIFKKLENLLNIKTTNI